ncbi:platelet-activating factor acetylhydrolase-like [Mytilus edulis]|uniref:platelet-activating factor acetylhydrolase-like n=1 Tax=Mytilus edulis TaxID=6550 RepID=UPI0039F09820
MNSDSIFHQCFSQQGLHKSQSDCSLEFKTLRRNDSFFKPKDKEKEKIRRHLPIGTGDYSVGCLDIMCDHSEKGSFFRLYYPIEKTDIYKRDKQWPLWLPRKQYGNGYAYFIRRSKSVLGKMFNWMGGDVYVPALWQHYPLPGKRYPVVIFSHGIGGNRTCNTTVCCELASQGYIVAAVEHRDGSASMTFQLKEDIKSTVNVSNSNSSQMHRTHSYTEEWMPFDFSPPRWDDYESRNKQVYTRAEECTRALNVLTDLDNGVTILNQLGGNFNLKLFKNLFDLSKVSLVGHSFGGSTTVCALSKDTRFKVGVMMDGWMHPLNEEMYKNITQPVLMINMETFQWQENVDQMQRLQQDPKVQRPMITIKGTCHQSVTDFQFLVKKQIGMFMDVRHTLSPKIAIDVSNKATLGFLRKHLGQTGDKYDSIIAGEHEHTVLGPIIARERPA